MAGLNGSPRRRASRSQRETAGISAPVPPPAQEMPRKPASRAGKRTWTPKELAAELAEAYGVPVCERSIVKRCRLPVGHPARIATLPAFPGRHYIPGAEALRLLPAEVCG